MAREFIKLFYAFGAVIIVISALILWRTIKDVVPVIGWANASSYCIMAVVFLVIGVGLLVVARLTQKKYAKLDAEMEKEA